MVNVTVLFQNGTYLSSNVQIYVKGKRLLVNVHIYVSPAQETRCFTEIKLAAVDPDTNALVQSRAYAVKWCHCA